MKSFKKFTVLALAAITLSGSLTSCATVFGGRITDAQKRKPMPGEPQRQVRTGALIADILLFWPGTLVDFATGAIYKPQHSVTAQKVQHTPTKKQTK
ncbi:MULTISPECIES: hypothetical protein [Spirosoma]|jgi:hypothetical protein|uniref:YceK/YidQ family lipoprotein n=1 Tax=Spirosoma liriopis TaxID=2937440 RepID=A0ABT0HHQ7_9BACT|nr:MULTISPECIES: hypothetical protein [Spirosoma]MCK8491105.1 hypothetical protein [Spirosoma liriopis]UHG90487.1 hypothetical protein LQ777_19820 [Spirosoma oryzicola]